MLRVSKYYLKYITRHNIEQYKCADDTSMEESVDNDGESILRTLTHVRVSDARASELSVATVGTGPARHLLGHT